MVMAGTNPTTREENAFPSELIALLQDFILAAVKEDPEDIISYAASYFQSLQEKKKKNDSTDAYEQTNAVINESSAIPKLSTLNCASSDGANSRNSISKKSSLNRLLKRRNSIAGEPYEPFGSSRWEGCETVYPKCAEARQRVEKIVKDIFIFKSCSSEQLRKIIDAMYEREVFTDEVVIRQGDQGDNFYVIDQGKFVFLFEGDGGKEQIGSIEGPGSFGELALMYNCPRSATVKAVEEGVVWVLDRFIFKQILVDTTEMKRRYYEELLEGVPILSLLTAYERMTLADALETRAFEDNKCIIKQGSKADCMYFIEEGVVEIMLESDEQPSQVISSATRGDYFGELALVNKMERSASVYSRGKVVCAALDVDAFERLLGPCKDLMKRNVEKYENQRKMLGIKELPQR